MSDQDPLEVLNDPLAQVLLQSAIPARLAYSATDGSPRVVPTGFFWNGAQIVVVAAPQTPRVRALAMDPRVALTIDTNSQPPRVLLVRGIADIDVVDGPPPEFFAGARKLTDPDYWDEFVSTAEATYDQMARITITPTWARLMDFETRVPDFLTRQSQG
jgi:hypothetical protein